MRQKARTALEGWDIWSMKILIVIVCLMIELKILNLYLLYDVNLESISKKSYLMK